VKLRSILFILMLILLAGCQQTSATETSVAETVTPLATDGGAAPTITATQVTPTNEPTVEPTIEQATPEPGTVSSGLLVQQPDLSLIVIDPATGQIAPFGTPGVQLFPGSHTTIDVAQGKVYAIANQQIYEVTPAGTRVLNQYGIAVQGLAVLPVEGAPDHPLIAFGTMEPPQTRLIISPVDGFDATVVAEQEMTVEESYFAPIRWSDDGQKLYYSIEPTGLGGYILFGGFSNLYIYDSPTNTSTVLVPESMLGEQMVCLDDLSPDEKLVAHHCGNEGIGIVDTEAGQQLTLITTPADVTGWTVGGSAKFSPSGGKIAFAVAKNDPAAEQGWVIATDDLSGTSHLVATSAPGEYFTVAGWVDENTLVLQSYGNPLGSGPIVWIVPASGGEPTKIADGYYLTMMH